MLVMETIMPASKYCDDYPASDSLTFTNVALDGSTVDWTTRVQKTDCAESVAPLQSRMRPSVHVWPA